jgi:TolB-like protein
MTTTRTAALVLCALVASGCVSTAKRRYHDQDMDFGSIQRVAVLPLTNLSRDPAAGDRVRDVFANALLASSSIYVVPPGEVARVLSRTALMSPATLTTEEVMRVGSQLKVQAVITGTVKEYGETRTSGSASANIIAVSLQMVETASGKVVWSAASTKGGLSVTDRLFGSGGQSMNDVTDKAVDDLIDQLFK